MLPERVNDRSEPTGAGATEAACFDTEDGDEITVADLWDSEHGHVSRVDAPYGIRLR